MKDQRLSTQLLLLSGIPLLALLVFAGLLADRTYQTWRNVGQIVALGRLINAVEKYTHAVPAEAILSLGAQETGSTEQKALIPAARARSDAAVENLRQQARATQLVDSKILANLTAALRVDLVANRARVDAGTESLAFILSTLRPATLQAIELVGQLAVLSTDANVARLILAYNAALWMNDSLLVERNVRPVAGPNGQLVATLGEAEGIAQQEMLIQQFGRLASPAALPTWHRFLSDPASRDIGELRRDVLGIGGGTVNPAGLERWTNAVEQRLHAMAPVLEVSSESLRQAVAELESDARSALAGYAALVVVTFGLVLSLVGQTRQDLARRVSQLSMTMRNLAAGDLNIEMPAAGPSDELGEMTLTLASFKASLIERERLAVDQTAAAAALLDEKERLRVTLHSIGDGLLVTDADKRLTMMNTAAELATGWKLPAALGRQIEEVMTLAYPDGGAQSELSPDNDVDAETTRMNPGDATLIRPDGTELAIDISAALIFGQEGGLIGSITVLHDVTESRRLMTRIRQLAHFDTLTGLPNRALFHDRLAQVLRLANRRNQRCALLFLDLDRFKQVNDTLGHAIGDLLLRQVAQRLTNAVRASDTVARLGGDEFVVVLSDIADSGTAALVAQKILSSVAEIDSIEDHDVDISFSIGIAIYPDDAQSVDNLLMRADAAMYQAKDSGRNNSMFFDPEMDRITQHEVQTRLRLARALHLRQFFLLYQPKIQLASRRIVGAEALIRWQLEPGNLVMPADFIPVAEETGLILPIGDWMVNEVCSQMRSWAEQELPPIPVSINVSMKSLHSPSFLPTILAALQKNEIAPQLLELEITETTAMSDPEHTFAILTTIRSFGIRVSIDDFGTGFSSLSHLHRLPVDTIKIDRSFVHNMTAVGDDAALVSAIVGMAITLRKHVVAEGVETELQRAQLLMFGCHEAQGFLFAKPVHPNVFARMLAEEPNPALA